MIPDILSCQTYALADRVPRINAAFVSKHSISPLFSKQSEVLTGYQSKDMVRS